MKIMEQLSHPNIVEYYGIEVHRDKVYLFMEYVANGALTGLLENGGIENEDVIRHYGHQILLGLEYLHARKIVHRDIKPDVRLRIPVLIESGKMSDDNAQPVEHPGRPKRNHQAGRLWRVQNLVQPKDNGAAASWRRKPDWHTQLHGACTSCFVFLCWSYDVGASCSLCCRKLF